MAKFTVDTHIFRELGELLVGRDSTALIELIKNSYDADATEIVVYGEALDDPRRGFITITDNGIGMTQTEFENGFLRVASRLKEEGPRVSKRFGRRYTGAKGIGRLAAHKLAHLIQVHSTPWSESPSVERYRLDAIIDWDEIEAHQTLDDLKDDAILIEPSQVSRAAKHGTQIRLERLRRRWTSAELGRFLLEVDTFAPSPVLVKLPKGVLHETLLFEKPFMRDSVNSDANFNILLDGVFTPNEDYWIRLAQTATWIVEIDARKKNRSGERKVEYGIASTPKAVKDNPKIETQRFLLDHPAPEEGPFFQARILIKEGAPDKQIRSWASRANGIRVYMEGFRVLPYGEPKNDWLGLDIDYWTLATTLTNKSVTRPREGAQT
jgi:hypothetical protein